MSTNIFGPFSILFYAILIVFQLVQVETLSHRKAIQTEIQIPSDHIIINGNDRRQYLPSNQFEPPMRPTQLSSDSSTLPASTDNSMRAASFMVDPLIIIALIALPTIGMLGLSSLIMPLIPIGIYMIQQFFPAGAGRRRRRRSLPPLAINNDFQWTFEEMDELLKKMLHNFNISIANDY